MSFGGVSYIIATAPKVLGYSQQSLKQNDYETKSHKYLHLSGEILHTIDHSEILLGAVLKPYTDTREIMMIELRFILNS